MPRRIFARRVLLTATVVAVLAASAGLATTATASTPDPAGGRPPQLTVQLGAGTLRGTVSQGARAFLGVPYAAPPVNDLRFAAPQPAKRWHGVRSAARQGPACIQFQPTGVRNSQPTSEDCLYLDIYTPKTARAGDNLPVLFWMHGGGNTQGTGVIYGGQRFADLTHSVFVSINYRLGAYGWLSLPQLASAKYGTGNYGLLDQIAALKWVRANIAAFGGNRHNITIDGQSAGSSAVCNMLASPLAKGLFQRGILESGPCSSAPLTASAGTAFSRQYASAAGCPDGKTVAACLRAAWTPNLVAVEQQLVVKSPVSGTPVLPEAPAQAIADGHWNKVPLLIGNVASESKLFDIAQYNLTAAQYPAAIRAAYGKDAKAVLRHYPLRNYGKPFYALAAAGTDAGNACNSYWLAAKTASQVPTWEEEFNDPTSPTLYGFQPPHTDMSNAHSAELAYLWNFTLGARPLTTNELLLGKQMDRYWGAFAQSGNPNVAGQRYWPRVGSSAHRVLTLRPTSNTVSATSFPVEHQCAFWSTHEPTT